MTAQAIKGRKEEEGEDDKKLSKIWKVLTSCLQWVCSWTLKLEPLVQSQLDKINNHNLFNIPERLQLHSNLILTFNDNRKPNPPHPGKMKFVFFWFIKVGDLCLIVKQTLLSSNIIDQNDTVNKIKSSILVGLELMLAWANADRCFWLWLFWQSQASTKLMMQFNYTTH